MAVPVIALLVFVVTFDECDAACGDWDFVSDLLLDNQQDRAIAKWEFEPSVGVDKGTAEETRMAAGAVHELNELLSGTGFRLHFKGAEQSDIQIVFGLRDELNQQNPDYQIDGNVLGYARRYRLNSSVHSAKIFVVSSLPQGSKWGTLLHEIGHALGVAGHTDRYLSSLFHSERGYGSWSDGFSADDRKLVRFLYQHLKSGMNEAEVRALFDAHWVPRSR